MLIRAKVITAVLIWGLLFLIFFVHPVLTYNQGTSRGVSYKLVAQPFIQSDEMKYRWIGEVYRSCDITVRRHMVDSLGVLTDLEAKHFDKGTTGFRDYEIPVPVPHFIAEGPATYHPVEVPACSWLQRLFPVEIPYPVVEFNVTGKRR